MSIRCPLTIRTGQHGGKCGASVRCRASTTVFEPQHVWRPFRLWTLIQVLLGPDRQGPRAILCRRCPRGQAGRHGEDRGPSSSRGSFELDAGTVAEQWLPQLILALFERERQQIDVVELEQVERIEERRRAPGLQDEGELRRGLSKPLPLP